MLNTRSVQLGCGSSPNGVVVVLGGRALSPILPQVGRAGLIMVMRLV